MRFFTCDNLTTSSLGSAARLSENLTTSSLIFLYLLFTTSEPPVTVRTNGRRLKGKARVR